MLSRNSLRASIRFGANFISPGGTTLIFAQEDVVAFLEIENYLMVSNFKGPPVNGGSQHCL